MAQRQFRSDDTSVWLDKYGNGSDGAYAPSTSTDAPIDSACTGTISTTSLTATNASFATGQLILIHQTQGTGAGQWEFNKIASYSTGTITTSYPLIYDYVTGAQVIVLKQYTTGNIATGQTITVKAWNGTVGGIFGGFFTQSFTGEGSISGSGKGFLGGPNTFVTLVGGLRGEGTSGNNGTRQTTANGNGGGGGAGFGSNGSRGGGGGGGNASSGSNGSSGAVSAGGTGGNSVGNAELTLIDLGGGGGQGGNGVNASDIGGGGGSGGPIIIIVAKNIDVSSLTINLNGANGDTNANGDGGRGAGGAGGSCLLKGQTIVTGTNKITASGGSTGSGGSGGNGGSGSVGRIHADYSSTITGTTTPTIDTRQDLALRTGNMFMVFD